MSDETKTSKEIYDALIAAGIECCDVVRMNNGDLGTVTVTDEWGMICIETENDSLIFYKYNDDDDDDNELWPTRFCRPMFSREIDAFVLESFFSSAGESSTATISYEPVPLTLEERIERLESELKGLKELMCL
jgi:hypothetical protein